MTRIFCFSGSGHSLAVAKALSSVLCCDITEICGHAQRADTAVVIFPVYCQNIPVPVKAFLKELQAKHTALIATYGRISYGNVLQEAQKLVRGDVIVGAYIPIGHTFLDGDFSFDQDILPPIADRIRHPKAIRIPKSPKNPFSDIFPGFRSRISVRIKKNALCDSCGICEARCPKNAIKKGRITSKCIRCLRCVADCPQGALSYENTRILNCYLHRYSKPDSPTLYL